MKRLVTGLWYWSSVIECVDSSGEQRWAHATAQFHGVSAVLAAFPGWLAWLLCCVSMCCYVIPIQKPGQHWKSLPVSPDQFWKAFYTTFTNKDKIMTDESTEVLHHVVWEGYSLQWPRLYSNVDILCCVQKRCLSDSVFRSITEGWSHEGSVEVLHWLWLSLLSQKAWLLMRKLSSFFLGYGLRQHWSLFASMQLSAPSMWEMATPNVPL